MPAPIMMIIHSYERRIFRSGLKLPLCSSNAMQGGIHYEGRVSDDPVTENRAEPIKGVPECSSFARQSTKDNLQRGRVVAV